MMAIRILFRCDVCVLDDRCALLTGQLEAMATR